MFPMHEPFHDMNMVPNPVDAAYQDFMIDKYQPSVTHDIDSQLMYEFSQFRVLRCEDAWETSLYIII